MEAEARHRRRLLGSGLAILTLAHAVLPSSAHAWHWLHTVLASAYLPLIFAAATWFGMRGGLLCAAAAAGFYTAHLLWQWARAGRANPDQFAYPAVFLFVAWAAGRIVDDARRKRWERDEVIRRERATALRNGVAGLAAAFGASDPARMQRAQRLADLAARAAVARGLPSERAELVRLAALLHGADAALLRALDDGGELTAILHPPDAADRGRERRLLDWADAYLRLTAAQAPAPPRTPASALAELRATARDGDDAADLAALAAALAGR